MSNIGDETYMQPDVDQHHVKPECAGNALPIARPVFALPLGHGGGCKFHLDLPGRLLILRDVTR